jgi:EmrB/QacA subfamily drug resistance transporter
VRLGESGRAWWALIGSCLALFILMLDSTEVVLALPVIERDLGMSSAGVQWVQNAYLLALAATVISWGRIGDIVGRRRIFITGMIIFAAGTVVAATAGDELMLIVARLIQGTGGAAMFALSLALASNAFPPERQATAVGIWAGVSSLALGIGPLVGGVLVEDAGWRWIFWTYLPLCVVSVVILRFAVAQTRDPEAAQRVDVRGLALVSAGLGLVVLSMVEAEAWGFPSAPTLGCLAAGAFLLACFWRIEHHVQGPLLDFSLFRNRPYFGASIAALAIVGAYWTVMYLEPQYLQGTLGHSTIAAGALVLPITLPLVVISPFTARVMARLGARRLLVGGLLVAAASIAALALLGHERTYAAVFLPYLGFGIALALLYAPVSSAAMAAMPRSKAGIAAGVLGMQRLVAGALLLALSGAVFQALDDSPGVPANAVAWALVVPCAALVLGALAAAALLPGGSVHHEPRIEHHRLHF